ncbi:MAG: hypothetical protein CMF48_01985 [Legionellales bacterium]|nr:hypothetical protein [Legionellales bacterium]|tara:strand:- start:790 stop:1872 length:1083 start_codon:yes stop_codon:yes gene_type:complete
MFLFQKKSSKKPTNKELAKKVAELSNEPFDISNTTPEEFYQAIKENLEEFYPTSSVENDYESTYVSAALTELTRLKDRLGGSPKFGDATPSLYDPDDKYRLFGHPMSAVKDWLRMTQRKKWPPRFFWHAVGKLFGANIEDTSTYESTYIFILRFGRMLAHKEHLKGLLRANDPKVTLEFNELTGMGWHPNQNSPEIEIFYMDFIEKFLTDDLHLAQKAGDDVLIAYFSSFTGVCFEDRCRILQEFSQEHLYIGESNQYKEVADWSTDEAVEEALQKELVVFALSLGPDTLPTVGQFYDHLNGKNFFEVAFMKENGEKAPMTKQEYIDWTVRMIEDFILDEDDEPRSDLQPETSPRRNSSR